MLERLYQKIVKLANHPHAMAYLLLIAFAESSIFPIPPDPIFITMIVARREQAFTIAFLTTLASVIGGYVGYALGYYLYETLGQWIINTHGMANSFERIKMDFDKWGFWIIALKGLTPIPYKIVTIASGLVKFDLGLFTIASLITRSFRFFLVGTLLWYYGPPIKIFIEKNLRLVLFLALMFLLVGFAMIKLF